MRNHFAAGLLIIAIAAAPAAAQSRWKEIGKTSAGNVVSIAPKSVKTKNGIITADLQVRFVTPVETPQGKWMLSRHVAMFDCAKKAIAAKSTTYYGDVAATKVIEKKVTAQPGFGPALGGSMAQVALDYVCKK